MKVILAIAAGAVGVVLSVGSASALSPEGERCVTSQGYKVEDWTVTRSVPRGPADKIRACFARIKARKGQ